MIQINEAIELIGKHTNSFAERLQQQQVPFCDAHQQSIIEDIVADRGNPPFHRVAMDGIAILHKSFQQGIRKFPIIGIQKAGEPAKVLDDHNSCLEVMTGSVLPENTDAVIPYETITIDNNEATLQIEDVEYLQNVHQKDSDYCKKDILIKQNTILTAPRIGILASVGKNHTIVKSTPKIAIISTGDELVDVNEVPKPHQIRRSNSYALKTLLEGFGFFAIEIFHIKDDEHLLQEELQKILQDFDCLLLSGGVSMGKFDFVPKVLESLHIQNVFYKVAQKPGKPMWFGVSPKNQLIFGLPGNPVSVLVCARRYVIPALLKAKKETCFELKASLTEEVHFAKNMTLFKPVAIKVDDNAQILAQPIKMNGSGDFASLGSSDGIIELPQDKNTFLPGEVYPLYLWTRTFYGNAS